MFEEQPGKKVGLLTPAMSHLTLGLGLGAAEDAQAPGTSGDMPPHPCNMRLLSVRTSASFYLCKFSSECLVLSLVESPESASYGSILVSLALASL